MRQVEEGRKEGGKGGKKEGRRDEVKLDEVKEALRRLNATPKPRIRYKELDNMRVH